MFMKQVTVTYIPPVMYIMYVYSLKNLQGHDFKFIPESSSASEVGKKNI